MLLTKAAVVKAASLVGLVCTTATTTYVAHKPIRKAVERVKHKVAPKARYAKKAPVKASRELPECLPVRIAPLPDVPPLNITPNNINIEFKPLPGSTFADTYHHFRYHKDYPPMINGGGYVFGPNITTPPPSGVPEPATWGLMILGFGISGSIARMNRKQKARQ